MDSVFGAVMIIIVTHNFVGLWTQVKLLGTNLFLKQLWVLGLLSQRVMIVFCKIFRAHREKENVEDAKWVIRSRQTMQENKKKDKVRNIIEHYKYMHTKIFDEVLFIVHIYDLVFDPL